MATFFKQLIRKSLVAEKLEGDFQIADFHEDLLHKLNEYRKQGELCDIVLVVGNRNFSAHRAVLSANSKFFEVLFSNGMRESQQAKITLSEVDSNVMEDLLTYFYTGIVQVTEESARCILQAADFLMLERLKEMCAFFVESHLNGKNCLSGYLVADMYRCEDIKAAAIRLICYHLEELMSMEDFCNLTARQIHEIVSYNEFLVGKERVVCDAVLKWAGRDLNTRVKDILLLFSHIRLDTLDKDYVKYMLCSDLVKRDVELSAELANVLQKEVEVTLEKKLTKCFVLDATGEKMLLFCPEECQSYTYYHKRNLGQSWMAEWQFICDNVHIYKLSNDCNYFRKVNMNQEALSDLPSPPSRPVIEFGTAVLKSYLYVVGGRCDIHERVEDAECTNVVQRYSPKDNTWQVLAPMNNIRSDFTIATDSQFLYAIGGVGEDFERVNAFERYDPVSNTWTELTPVKELYGTEAVAVDGYVLIYNIAGCCKYAMQVYSPEDGLWHNVSETALQTRVRGFEISQVVNIDDKIFVCCKDNLGKYRFLFSNICTAAWQTARCGTVYRLDRHNFDIYNIKGHLLIDKKDLDLNQSITSSR